MGRTAEVHDGDYQIIYTKYVTLKNKRRIYAASYGKKSFRIKVRRKKK